MNGRNTTGVSGDREGVALPGQFAELMRHGRGFPVALLARVLDFLHLPGRRTCVLTPCPPRGPHNRHSLFRRQRLPPAYPEEEVQGVLDGAEGQGVLAARQVDGQVVELLPLGHHLPAAGATT